MTTIDFSKISVSFFSSVFDVAETVNLQQMFEWLTNGHFDNVIQLHETLAKLTPLSPEWKAAKDNGKQKMACWTPGCEIHEGMKRCDANIKQMNGLVSIDYDYHHQEDKERFLRDFMATMTTLPYVVYCGKSVSGSGYFVLVLTDSTAPERYKPTYSAIVAEMEKFGWKADAAASSLSNFRFVSYDPHPFINPEPVPFKSVTAEEAGSGIAPQKKAYVAPEFKVKSKQEEYDEILRIIRENPNSGISDDEREWFHVGLAFAGHFGEAGRALYHEYSALWPRYCAKDVDKKYNWCLANGNGSVSIAKFYYVCQLHGI